MKFIAEPRPNTTGPTDLSWISAGDLGGLWQLHNEEIAWRINNGTATGDDWAWFVRDQDRVEHALAKRGFVIYYY